MKIYSYSEIRELAYQINNKEIIETKEILMRQNKDGFSVAHRLVWDSGYTSWSTNDKKILMIKDKDGYSVAHGLAHHHSTWITDDPEILSLYAPGWKETVEDTLIQRGKL